MLFSPSATHVGHFKLFLGVCIVGCMALISERGDVVGDSEWNPDGAHQASHLAVLSANAIAPSKFGAHRCSTVFSMICSK